MTNCLSRLLIIALLLITIWATLMRDCGCPEPRVTIYRDGGKVDSYEGSVIDGN